MYYAQITDSVVTAVTETAGPIDAPNMIAIDGLLNIAGHRYAPATGVFTPPAPPVVNQIPQKVTAFQAKAALLHADLLDSVETMMADPATPRIVKLSCAETLHFERTSPTVAAMASALNLTDADVDALFVYAAEVQA